MKEKRTTPITKAEVLVLNILGCLDALKEMEGELTLSHLQRLEKQMANALRVNVIEVIAKKQVPFTIEGYAINPLLPDNFSNCPNDQRPESHRFWWGRPFILTKTSGDRTVFWVECLDGGAWDRPTWWGEADTLDAAVEICRTGPNWTKPQ